MDWLCHILQRSAFEFIWIREGQGYFMVNTFYVGLICVLLSMGLDAEGASTVAKKVKIQVGGKVLIVELADTALLRKQGLMNRTKPLSERSGMLFAFPNEKILDFWMKNTFVPLTIGFFNSQKKLIEILDMKPVKTILDKHIPEYHSKHLSMYALEVNRGWFKRNKIPLGSKFSYLSKPKMIELK